MTEFIETAVLELSSLNGLTTTAIVTGTYKYLRSNIELPPAHFLNEVNF